MSLTQEQIADIEAKVARVTDVATKQTLRKNEGEQAAKLFAGQRSRRSEQALLRNVSKHIDFAMSRYETEAEEDVGLYASLGELFAQVHARLTEIDKASELVA